MSSEQRIAPSIALVVAIIAISFGAILVRLSEAPSTVAAFYRVLFTALPLIPIAVWKYRRHFARLTRHEIGVAILAGGALGLHFATWFESLSWTSVAASVTLVQAQPLFVGLGAWFILREQVSRRMAIGIGIALLGMAGMSIGELVSGVFVGPRPMLGNGLAVFAAIMTAIYVLVGRSLRQRIALIPYVVIVYVVCTITLGLIMIGQGQPMVGYPTREWLLFILMAIGPGLIGHTVINWTLAHLDSSVVSVSLLGEPVGATILAIVILTEFPTAYTVVGGLIVLGGIYLTARETETGVGTPSGTP